MSSLGGSPQKGWASSSEGTGANHWKHDKRILSIDFESLDKLLLDESDCDEEQSDILRDISSHDANHLLANPFTKNGPSKLILHSSSTNSIFHANEFKDLEKAGKDLREIFSQNGEDAWWLDMQNPSELELRHICAAFNIHPLTIEDIWKREASEKIEEYPTYRFSSFTSFHEIVEDDEVLYKPYTIYMVVFSRGTLSFCFDENAHSSNVEKRITKFEDLLSMKSDWIFYAFVDDIVDSFVPAIAKVESAVNEVEDQVYTTREDNMKEFLWQIEAIRKRVLSLIRLLGGKDKVLRGFENHHNTTQSPDQDILLYINDVQDHIVTMISNLKQYEGLLSRSKDNYIAQLEATSLTDTTRVYTFMSRMSVFAMILTTVTLTSNLFGVNVSEDNGLWEGDSVGPWLAIVGSEVLVTAVLFMLAIKYERHW